MSAGSFRHIDTQAPRIMVVDGSKLARKMIEQLLRAELPGMEFIGCESGKQAKEALLSGQVNLVTTALALPDMDGLDLAKFIREYTPQAFIPIIVVSGNVQERLESRDLSEDVTDYFDKALGFGALATFIRGYVKPEDEPGGEVLYIEDSRVVAVATRRMMEKHGLKVAHVVSVEEALERLQVFHDDGTPPPDILLSDVYLKGDLTGSDLLVHVRKKIGYNKTDLPIIMMTGDSDPANQSALLRAGANDLVEKPIEENLLIAKLLFQLRTGRVLRAKRDALVR
ncbi:MAG: response regulator [Proteobacteria bacterium]|nr:response regulator [Pseudomonadota bacterium]MBS0462707.1 response regulator [Pseudomonadota bacterium]